MKSLIPVAFLLAALAILAALQYRWIGEVSRAERQRLENGLRDSSERFSRDFAEEFARIPRMFEQRGLPDQPPVLIERYREWLTNASHPKLIKNVYLVNAGPGESTQLYRLDVEEGSASPAPIPGNLDFPNYLVTPRGIVFELDPAVLTGEVLPALQERHFPTSGEQNYRIAVVSTGGNQEILYSSPETWSAEDLARPDYAVELFGGPPGQIRIGDRGGPPPRPDPSGFDPRRGGPPRRGGGPRRGGPFEPPSPRRNEFPGGEPPRVAVPQAFRDFPGARLRLLVKHEAGSLEVAVGEVRQRNLAVSFGILVVLAGAAFTVLVSSQRARTLGKMQVEFAAGVSHELRTPLAVIQSAAHNLRSGVVRDSKAIEQYAGMVQSEARRLSDMVEQVMAYAETQSGKKRYDVSAVDVRDVIDQALRNLPVDVENVRVEQRIEDGLPPALADPLALSQCLQNLISNSLKYGRRDNHVDIEIEARRDKATGKILLGVMDRGSGVPANEVRHLFDPFHRGSNATAGVPGNGLGLHLVRKAMEAQNGAVEYAARPSGGAAFTLTIPAATSDV